MNFFKNNHLKFKLKLRKVYKKNWESQFINATSASKR